MYLITYQAPLETKVVGVFDRDGLIEGLRQAAVLRFAQVYPIEQGTQMQYYVHYIRSLEDDSYLYEVAVSDSLPNGTIRRKRFDFNVRAVQLNQNIKEN